MSDLKEISMGVAGVGAIGRNHARVLASLPGVKLAGIYDVDSARAAELAAEHGTRAAASLAELASWTEAITVATPTVYHYETGKTLLEAGKHVLIEKPITDNTEQALELAALAKARSLVLQVGHIERFNPVMSLLEERLTSPRFIEAHRLSPFPNRSIDIGVVLDLMIHDIEIVLNLVRSPIESIDAVGVAVLTRREDIANARLRFENGCVANLTASRISPERLRKLRVFQSDAYLSLDYQAQEGKIYRREGMAIVCEDVIVEKDEPLKLELAAFAECARHGLRPRVGGREAAAALDLAMRITKLIEEGNVKGLSAPALGAPPFPEGPGALL
ncbi:MAG: Gfo/Idh/MocA family oxidoreductase [Verrucomicrobiota bacterium]